MADNGHDITMPARLGPQNAKAILGIMVRDALDEPGKNLLRRFSDGCFMVGSATGPCLQRARFGNACMCPYTCARAPNHKKKSTRQNRNR
jgi:hypothetical protein